MNYLTIVPEVSGVPVTARAATADFTTDSIEIKYNHGWALQFVEDSTDGTPLLTIECSDDDENFIAYKDIATSVDMTIPANRLLFDSIFTPRYFRVKYEKGGATTGTVGLILNLKKT